MKILVTNVFGNYNKGDRALFESLVAILVETFGHPQIHTVVRFQESLGEIYHGLTLHIQFSKCSFRKRYLKIAYYVYIHVFVLLYLFFPAVFSPFLKKRHRETVKAFKEAHLVISCPGGFLEDSNRSYYVNLFQIWIAVLLKKPIVIAPQSIGPIRSKLGRRMLHYILCSVDMIFVRERRSYYFLINTLNISESKVALSADLAFFYRKCNQITVRADFQPGIHYSTVVNWSFPLSHDPLRAEERYINAMVEYYRYLYKNYNLKTIILNQVGTDLPIARKIEKRAKEFVQVDVNSYTPSTMINMIGLTKIFTGARFHSCIFSMLAHVPCISVSYLPKTKGMMEWLGLSMYCIDIYDVTCDNMIRCFNSIYYDYEETKSIFNEKIQEISRNNNFETFLKASGNSL